tara:strand:- start:194 stop:451 length:258 start_codon:yes stop_codon:yes gene_type:complete
MKDLGLSWNEVRNTPRRELDGLLLALSNYNQIHQFDGYDSNDIKEMAKNKPQARTAYLKSMEKKKIFERRAGKKEEEQTFKGLIK